MNRDRVIKVFRVQRKQTLTEPLQLKKRILACSAVVVHQTAMIEIYQSFKINLMIYAEFINLVILYYIYNIIMIFQFEAPPNFCTKL